MNKGGSREAGCLGHPASLHGREMTKVNTGTNEKLIGCRVGESKRVDISRFEKMNGKMVEG